MAECAWSRGLIFDTKQSTSGVEGIWIRDMSFYKVLNIKVSEHKSSFGGTQRRKSYRSNCRKQQAASRVSRTPLACPEVNSPVSLTPQEENRVGAEGATCKMLTWDGIRQKGRSTKVLEEERYSDGQLF